MFNFKIIPRKSEEQKAKEDEEVRQFAEENRKKMLSASMQSNVLQQLASVQPHNPNAQAIPPQNVESKQGW